MIRRSDFIFRSHYVAARMLDRVGRLLLGHPRITPMADLWCVDRVAVIRLDHVGDLLLTTPAIRAIRRRFPGARLTCVVGEWAAPVLRGNPHIDDAVILSAPWFAVGGYRGQGTWQAALTTALRLRRRRYDLSLDFRSDFRGAALGFVIGARCRLGMGRKGGGPFLTDLVDPPPGLHALDVHEHFLHALGAVPQGRSLDLFVSEEDRDFASSFLHRHGLAGGDRVFLAHPFANAPAKEWGVERWQELARGLHHELGGAVLLTGPADRAGATKVLIQDAGVPIVPAVGETSLSQLAALMERASCVITVDSAARHVAVAMGVPVVVIRHGADGFPPLLGAASPHELLVQQEVPCSPCGQLQCPRSTHDCMDGVSASHVLRIVVAAVNAHATARLH